MQHHHYGDYNFTTTTLFYYPPPNPTTHFHHQPPYASAPPFSPTTTCHPPPPPPPPPYHPTNLISPSNRYPMIKKYPHFDSSPYISCSTFNNNNVSLYDDNYDHHNFPPPPPKKWLLGKKHDLGASIAGDGVTWKNEVVIDHTVPKKDVTEGGGEQKFRVKWLAETGGQSTMDVLCQIKLDGIQMRDPSTRRTLKIYPLDTITNFEVYDSSTFAFWYKSTVDIEPRRVRLQSDSYTTNTLLDTITAATIQIKEMDGRTRPVDAVKVTEQSTEKKEGSGDEMDIIKPPDEENHQWVLYKSATNCSGCGGDVSASNKKRHCRQCGDMFCNKCTRERIALPSEDNAPQVRGNIKCQCDNARRRNHNELCYAQGESKSAAKRRAQKLGRCFKCGNFSHDKACPENHDNDFRNLFFHGPIRCYTERLLNPRGYAHARMNLELDRLSENTKRKFSS
uniref:protein FREE1-like n=1 Tax=Erigeron canadensis TaxID=72917 RepID=UPI001CB8BD28|nr:protein FREE1-like [Erigeron canadensis]